MAGRKYEVAELIDILKDAPTTYNVIKHSKLQGRTEAAIKLVHRCAAGEKVRGTGWDKVNALAKRIGWMQLASG